MKEPFEFCMTAEPRRTLLTVEPEIALRTSKFVVATVPDACILFVLRKGVNIGVFTEKIFDVPVMVVTFPNWI
jgi:hypothetical protein